MRAIKILIITAVIILSAGIAQSGNPGGIARAFLLAWQSGDYSTMYALLSVHSKQFISQGEFIDDHRDFARQYVIERYSIIETIDLGQTAIVNYELALTGIGRPSKYQTGKLELVKENNLWCIEY
jgi:hypothetical protein